MQGVSEHYLQRTAINNVPATMRYRWQRYALKYSYLLLFSKHHRYVVYGLLGTVAFIRSGVLYRNPVYPCLINEIVLSKKSVNKSPVSISPFTTA